MTQKSIKSNQNYSDKTNTIYRVVEVRRPNAQSRGYVTFYRGDSEIPCTIFFDEFYDMVKIGFLKLNKEPKKPAASAALLATVSAVAAANPAGFTYDIEKGENPASGYCVALAETQDSHGAEAIALGRANKQLAIFHLDTCEEIRL